ncbi:MAG: AI-2E family transporter [Planctomycetota bacterium]
MEGFVRKRGVRLGLLLLVSVAALTGIYWLSDIFAPLLLGFLIAYVLDPIADRLQRLRLSRFNAVLVIFIVANLLALIGIVGGSFLMMRGVHSGYLKLAGDRRLPAFPKAGLSESGGPVELRAGVHYVDRVKNDKYDPGYLIQLKNWVFELPAQLGIPEQWRDAAREWIDEKRESILRETDSAMSDTETIKQRLEQAWKFMVEQFAERRAGGDPQLAAVDDDASESVGFLRLLSYLVLCPLYVFFFLLEFDSIIGAIERYLPSEQRERVMRIFRQIDATLAAFFRGRLIVCLLKGAITALLLLMLGVPFWLPIGLAAGFVSLIPYIGIFLAVVPALGLSWFEHHNLLQLVGVAAVFGAMEAAEGFVLIPRFLGKEVGLHPLTIIVTLLVFGKLLGFVGVLLSVPLAAITKILAVEFILPLLEELRRPPKPA